MVPGQMKHLDGDRGDAGGGALHCRWRLCRMVPDTGSVCAIAFAHCGVPQHRHAALRHRRGKTTQLFAIVLLSFPHPCSPFCYSSSSLLALLTLPLPQPLSPIIYTLLTLSHLHVLPSLSHPLSPTLPLSSSYPCLTLFSFSPELLPLVPSSLFHPYSSPILLTHHSRAHYTKRLS